MKRWPPEKCKPRECGDCHQAEAVAVMFATRPRDPRKLVYRCPRCVAEYYASEQYRQDMAQDAKQIRHLQKKIDAFKKDVDMGAAIVV